MKCEWEIIHAFLQDKEIKQCHFFPLLNKFNQPDQKRKDVCKELSTQLESIIEEFPIFNRVLWNEIFHDEKECLEHIIILPVVGTEEHNVIKKDGQIYLLLDLIKIANITPIISQMVYVMENFLTLEITKLCIHARYPLSSKNYLDLLDYFTFTNGLSHFLSWNEDAKLYKFYTDKYEPYKEKAFSMLAQSLDIENKALQHNILIHATSGDFWSQFPKVAGMFYFDDIFREYGNQGIVFLYQKGPKRFIQHIFQE